MDETKYFDSTGGKAVSFSQSYFVLLNYSMVVIGAAQAHCDAV
jgi:hypothetical protein